MYKRILVPVDGSEVSNKAAVAALQFARECGGRIRFVHLLDELAYVSYFDYEGQVFEAARLRAHKVLADAQAMAESAGVAADTRLVERAASRLGEVVAQEAREWEADLVAVGTHGRHGVSRLMLGSGAEQVLRLAPVPVLAVRAAPGSTG